MDKLLHDDKSVVNLSNHKPHHTANGLYFDTNYITLRIG